MIRKINDGLKNFIERGGTSFDEQYGKLTGIAVSSIPSLSLLSKAYEGPGKHFVHEYVWDFGGNFGGYFLGKYYGYKITNKHVRKCMPFAPIAYSLVHELLQGLEEKGNTCDYVAYALGLGAALTTSAMIKKSRARQLEKTSTL
jgi:hypothetical protein